MARKKPSERIYKMWTSANSEERIKWQSDSQKGYDFYLNEQLTEEERDILRESGMPTFEINRITPIIEIFRFSNAERHNISCFLLPILFKIIPEILEFL